MPLPMFNARSNVYSTSAAVSSLPLLNFTPGRRLKVQVKASSEAPHDSANIPLNLVVSAIGLPSASSITSYSNSRSYRVWIISLAVK